MHPRHSESTEVFLQAALMFLFPLLRACVSRNARWDGWTWHPRATHSPFLTRERLEISGEISGFFPNQGEVPMASGTQRPKVGEHLGIIRCRKQPSGPDKSSQRARGAEAENLGERWSGLPALLLIILLLLLL